MKRACFALVLVGCPAPPDCPDDLIPQGDLCVPADGCGEAPWGDAIPDGAAFIDASAEEGGDGTAERPWRDLQAAVTANPSGRFALAAGTYPTVLRLDASADGLLVHGRCSSLVTLDAAAAQDAGVLLDPDGQPAGITLEGLRLSGAPESGIELRRRANATLRDVRIEAVTGSGVVVREGTLDAEDLVIRDITILPALVGSGSGIYADGGSTVTVRRFDISACDSQGIHTLDTVLTLIDGVIHDITPNGAPWASEGRDGPPPDEAGEVGVYEDGIALSSERGAVTITDLEVHDVRSAGVAIFNATGTVRGLSVVDTAPNWTTDDNGSGLVVTAGADVSVEDLTLLRNHRTGIVVTHARLEIDRALIQDTFPEVSTGKFGRAAEVVLDGHLVLRNADLLDNHDLGIVIDRGSATLADVRIERTAPREVGLLWGRGIEALRGSVLIGDRLEIRDNLTDGIALHESEATLRDVLVERTGPEALSLNSGRGIQVQAGSHLDGERITLQDNMMDGLFVGEGSTVVLRDSLIQRTRVDAAVGRSGRGAAAFDGSSLELIDVEILDSIYAGLSAENGHLTLRGVTIDGVALAGGGGLGYGVELSQGSTLVADDLTVRGTAGVGLVVGPAAEATCDGCRFDGVTSAGIVSAGDSDITDTEITGIGGGPGVGVWRPDGGGDLALTGVTVQGAALAAVLIQGSGRVELVDSDFRGSTGYGGGGWGHGDGVAAVDGATPWDGTTGLRVDGCAFTDNAGAGVFLHQAEATLSDGTFDGNGVDVRQQACAGAPLDLSASGAVSSTLCPSEAPGPARPQWQ